MESRVIQARTRELMPDANGDKFPVKEVLRANGDYEVHHLMYPKIVVRVTSAELFLATDPHQVARSVALELIQRVVSYQGKLTSQWFKLKQYARAGVLPVWLYQDFVDGVCIERFGMPATKHY